MIIGKCSTWTLQAFPLLYGIRFWKVGWQIQQGSFRQLWIYDAVATSHGAGKHIPMGSDVSQNWAEARVGLCRGYRLGAFERQAENSTRTTVAKNEPR